MSELLFPLFLFGFVTLVVFGVGRLLLSSEYGRLRSRLRAGTVAAEAPEGRGGVDFGRLLMRIGQVAAKPFEPKTRERQSDLRRRLAQAGIYSSGMARVVIGCKVIFLGVGLFGGYLAGLAAGSGVLGLSLGGLLGYLVPSMWLKFRIRRQHRALEEGLPDAIDLMVVCVEAGLTLDAAVQRVGQEIALAHPLLAREMEITHMETRVGLSRAEAMRNLGQRTGCEPLQGLAAILIQADRFGTSIASALRVCAEGLRQRRQFAAEETAAKATVKLTFPLVLFIFPAVLIVLGGPAIIGLMKSALFAD